MLNETYKIDYSVMFSGLTTVDFQRKLQKDDIGISIHATCISIESKPAESKRSERKVRKYKHVRVMTSFRSCYLFARLFGTCFSHLLCICE